MSINGSYIDCAHCEPPVTRILVGASDVTWSHAGQFWGTKSSASICPTTISFPENTPSKAVKIVVAKREQIRFASHGFVSDSWRRIGFLSIHAAITTGRDTYHPLQNTTSIRWRIRCTNDRTIPNASFPISMTLRSIASHSFSLLYLPLVIVRKWSSGIVVCNCIAIVCSKLGDSPNQKKSCEGCWASAWCVWIYCIRERTGKTCHPVPPQAKAIRIEMI